MGAVLRVGLWVVLLGALLAVAAGLAVASRRGDQRSEPAMAASSARIQEPAPQRRTFEIVARRYAFMPASIEVREGDLVKIVFSTEDIPHSFTIDEYRIVKRGAPGRPVTFQFQADKPGRFVFYCNLTTEEGCKKMRGELIVLAR